MSDTWSRPDYPEDGGYGWAGQQASSASTATASSGKREAMDLPLAYRKKARTSEDWAANEGVDPTVMRGFTPSVASTDPQSSGAQIPDQSEMMAQMSAQMISQMWGMMSAQMGSSGQFLGTHTPTHEQYQRLDDENGWGSNQSLPIPGDMPGDGKRFTGRIKRSYEMQGGGGYGFIESNEAKMKYGRDVYIHAKQLVGYQIGDSVSFTITKNAKGEPQARNVMRTEDAVILRAQQHQNQQMQELQLLQKQRNTAVPMAAASSGGIMTEEEAKRFQASLRKNRM